jgi:hypothetical protein
VPSTRWVAATAHPVRIGTRCSRLRRVGLIASAKPTTNGPPEGGRVLTSFRLSHRLIVVQRVVALLLIPALMATSGVGSLLHTHVYTDHDHPEHHHGLAAHEHYLTPTHPDAGVTRVEGCDPGIHTVSFASLCAAVPQVPVVVAEFREPGLQAPDLQSWQPIGYADVRVHGPPSRSQASPRAPPVALHA